MADWLVAFSENQRHRLAVDSISTAGFSCFSPVFEVDSVFCGRIIHRYVPLFGRYVLVVMTNLWRNLFGIRGVAGLIMNSDGWPSLALESEVEAIRRNCDERNIFRDERNIFRPAGSLTPPKLMMFGDRVTPKSGPLLNHNGIYQGVVSGKNESALFVLFGRERVVKFKRGELSLVG